MSDPGAAAPPSPVQPRRLVEVRRCRPSGSEVLRRLEWRRSRRPSGVLQHVDYLEELGVDVVWLLPIYASPHDDNGCDISDYQVINPSFGTLEDLDRRRWIAGVVEPRHHRIGVFDHPANCRVLFLQRYWQSGRTLGGVKE